MEDKTEPERLAERQEKRERSVGGGVLFLIFLFIVLMAVMTMFSLRYTADISLNVPVVEGES